MELQSKLTYGLRASSVSRRRRKRGGGWGKKLGAGLVVALFIFACVSFVRSGIFSFTSDAEKAANCISRAESYLAGGDFNAALTAFDEALGFEPQNATALAGMGDAYVGLEKDEEAEKAYMSALEADATCERAYRGLITLNIKWGRATDARMWLSEAMDNGTTLTEAEWPNLAAELPTKEALVVADETYNFADGTVTVTEDKVVYTDGKTAQERVIYIGAPSKRFASDGVNVYIYDTGAQQIFLADNASGLAYKVIDVYQGANSADPNYGNGSFCDSAVDAYLYFNEQLADGTYQTYAINTADNSYKAMNGVDIDQILLADSKIYYISHTATLNVCAYDGSENSQIASFVTKYTAGTNCIVYTEPVDTVLVDVIKYDTTTGDKKTVASSLNGANILSLGETSLSYTRRTTTTEEKTVKGDNGEDKVVKEEVEKTETVTIAYK